MFGNSDNPFFDRSFLLTGATRGLGPDLARALAARGARLLAVDDGQPALDDLAANIGHATTLACDFSDPLTALGIARWIAADHPDFGGMICNATSPRRSTSALQAEIIAPMSVIGLLDRLRPAGSACAVAMVLPARPVGRDVARLAGVLGDFNRNNVGCLSLTTALLEGDPGEISGRDRRSAAGAVLDALARDRRVLRLRPGIGRQGLAAPGLPGWRKPLAG